MTLTCMRCHHDENNFDVVVRMGLRRHATPILNVAEGLRQMRCSQCNADAQYLYLVDSRPVPDMDGYRDPLF